MTSHAWTIEVLTERVNQNHHVAIGYLSNVAGGTTTFEAKGTWKTESGAFESEKSVVIQATVTKEDLDKGESALDVAKGAAKAVRDESNQDAVAWRVTPTSFGIED